MPNQPADLDPVEDEELRVGRDPRPGRRRWGVVVAAVALAVAALVWAVTRRDESGRRSAERSAAASTASSGPDLSSLSPQTVVPATAPVLGGATQPVARCPSRARCRTAVKKLPSATVAALRERYAGTRVVSARTVTVSSGGGSRLLSRSIVARAGARRVQIEITPFVMGPDGFDRRDSGSVSTVYVESTASRYTVRVTLTEPRTARPDDLTVLRLARDPRLNAVG